MEDRKKESTDEWINNKKKRESIKHCTAICPYTATEVNCDGQSPLLGVRSSYQQCCGCGLQTEQLLEWLRLLNGAISVARGGGHLPINVGNRTYKYHSFLTTRPYKRTKRSPSELNRTVWPPTRERLVLVQEAAPVPPDLPPALPSPPPPVSRPRPTIVMGGV